ncbi:hypothetical protein [Sphingobium aquiterrae]|uniref:hypothetical protein n=1 Tax=Sphingobium aquiterrae TaxID=2038656 RepID=UPI003016A46B
MFTIFLCGLMALTFVPASHAADDAEPTLDTNIEKRTSAEMLINQLYPSERRLNLAKLLAFNLVSDQFKENDDLRHTVGLINFQSKFLKKTEKEILINKFHGRMNLSAESLAERSLNEYFNIMTDHYSKAMSLSELEEARKFAMTAAGHAYFAASDALSGNQTLANWNSQLRSEFNLQTAADVEWLRTEGKSLMSKDQNHE